MDAGQAWMADLDDADEPVEEPEYWEGEELTAAELLLSGPVSEAAGMCTADECSVIDAAAGPAGRPRSEGSVPDLVAAVLAASGDPALMTDADLVRSLAAWHAVGSRAAGRELRATEELLRRRRPRVWDRTADRAERARERLERVSPGTADQPLMPAVVASREAAAEIALALTATEYAATAQAELAENLSRRLPAAFGELDAGRADLCRVRLLAEATQFLSDADAGKVDNLLAPSLGKMTTGDLRDRARKAVIAIDAAAADRRRERAERAARFMVYGNDDATATAAIERMPAHLGAAVKARVNAIARAARAAGMTGSMPLLEAKVAAGLLLDTLPQFPPRAGDGAAGGPGPRGPHDPGPGGDPWSGGWFTRPPADDVDDDGGERDSDGDGGGAEPDRGSPAAPDPEDAGAMRWPPIPAQAAAAAPGNAGVPAWLRPKAPGRIRLLASWRSLAGMSPNPAELSWIGPITPSQARELAAAAAADPNCPWHVIVTDEAGHAVAITTLRTRRRTGTGPGPPGLISEVTVTISRAMAAELGNVGTASDLAGRLTTVGQASDLAGRLTTSRTALARLLAVCIPAANLAAAEAVARTAANLAAGGCAHTMEVPGYHVPGRLRRWLTSRDRTCRNPVCRQPAGRCDQDHTIAYHRGGRSCSCNLGGVCRSHHKLKQLPGWQLSQDIHGTFTWRTPAGLTYRKEPYRYAF